MNGNHEVRHGEVSIEVLQIAFILNPGLRTLIRTNQYEMSFGKICSEQFKDSFHTRHAVREIPLWPNGCQEQGA